MARPPLAEILRDVMPSAPLSAVLLLRAIEAIYDAAPDPRRWPRALGAIADYFDDVGAILIWYRDNGTFGTIVSETLDAAQKDYEENGWASRDIKAFRARERGYFFSGEPFADRHIGFDEEMKNHPICVEFFTKHGLGWIGAVAVSPDPHVGVMLSVQRDAATKEQFSDEELEALRLISRHIEKSLRLSVRLLNAEVLNVGLGEALSGIGVGVFALDTRGCVLFSNPAAERLLGGAVQIANGRLRISGSSSATRLDEAISESLRGTPPDLQTKPILLECGGSDRRLAIYLLPIFQPLLAERFLTNTRAIVLMVEQKLDEPADPTIVRDLLGLTLGEAKMAAMIGVGFSPKDAAEKLGITESTARTVLKKVFSKTGVSRQSELVALLSKLLVR
jgi:DNA-binding CsgD family transcriptional regulator/PAS domain-containing protein